MPDMVNHTISKNTFQNNHVFDWLKPNSAYYRVNQNIKNWQQNIYFWTTALPILDFHQSCCSSLNNLDRINHWVYFSLSLIFTKTYQNYLVGVNLFCWRICLYRYVYGNVETYAFIAFYKTLNVGKYLYAICMLLSVFLWVWHVFHFILLHQTLMVYGNFLDYR